MPDWLAEGDVTIQVALGFFTAALALLAFRLRDRRLAVAAGVLAAVVVALVVIDRVVVTPYEQIVARVHRIADGVAARNNDAIFREVAESFQYGAVTKKRFREFADATAQGGRVTELQVWDFERVSVDVPGRKAVVKFMFKVRGTIATGTEFFICRATFVPEADGQWRLQTFTVSLPGDAQSSVEVPGLR